ncbi:hypothetical protein GOBAR_AA09120 [Gossypium barbadense]|uniref:Uncharacterized protein n=1 Tax=Gossypium barbadense TaxID=3634 RepID=A0A2P5Y7H3_GOSBA|nr:hypothetical protein GOBAR_AA09120 [Gossypium barbadense]
MNQPLLQSTLYCTICEFSIMKEVFFIIIRFISKTTYKYIKLVSYLEWITPLNVCSDFAALAAVLFWMNFQTYSSTKKLFPDAFYAAISAAMFFFYSYVVISGGNPPPKKMKLSAAH